MMSDASKSTAETIHGFPILRAQALPARPGHRAARVILVDRGEAEGPERYVTALHCAPDRSWLQGHYIETLVEAELDFATRVKKER